MTEAEGVSETISVSEMNDGMEVENVWCPSCRRPVTGINYLINEIHHTCCLKWMETQEERYVLGCKNCGYFFIYEESARCKGCGVQISGCLTFCPACGYQTKETSFDLCQRAK